MGAFRSIAMHPFVRRASQLAAGAIFVAAALPKIADLHAFSGSVHNFHLEPLVPVAAVNLLAMTIPWIELTAGLAMILGIKTRAGAFVYVGLMTLFTLGVVAAMARGLSFDCGCFGKATSTTIGAKKLAENLAMLVVGIVAALERRA